jgi:putative SOS response-associated peptidase YedK
MCGRFFTAYGPDALARRFGVAVGSNLQPRYNIAPTQTVIVVRRGDRGVRELAPMRWGLVPSWAKEVGSAVLNNARAETLAEKPSFQGAYKYRRGLLPASGWYEWRTDINKRKIPFAHILPDNEVLAFACIWEVWEGRGEGSWLETCAIVTTDAIGPAAAIHHRMPVLVHPDNDTLWINGRDGALPNPHLMSGDLIDRVIVHEANPDVNRAGNEGAYLLDPSAPPSGMMM